MGKKSNFKGMFSRNKQKTTTEDTNTQSSGFDMSNFGFLVVLHPVLDVMQMTTHSFVN